MNNRFNQISAVLATKGSNPASTNSGEKRQLFEVNYLENDKLDGIEIGIVPVKVKQFEIIWIKVGTGNFILDFLSYEIKENILYCLFPGQMYSLNPAREIAGYRISFSEEFLSLADDQSCLPLAMGYQCRDFNMQMMHVNKETETEIERIIQTMLWEYCNNFQFKAEILKGLLKIFIAYFSRSFVVNQAVDDRSNDMRLFRSFMNLLDRNYLTKKAVADYAEALSVSSNYLSEVIKKVSGHSASYHIQQRLILEAKRVAVYSEASMKDISYQLGFMDPAQFSKFFKNKTGMNFSAFKKGLTPFNQAMPDR